MHEAYESSTGIFISSEIKLAMSLRVLAGASYLDLSLLCDCGYSSAHRTFHREIKNWKYLDQVVKIDCHKNLTEADEMKKNSK